jgi:hypothetical protein
MQGHAFARRLWAHSFLPLLHRIENKMLSR